MKIILTEDFKNSTILADKGIRCILRGFALVNDTRHWMKKLYDNNLYNFESITLEELQEHCQLVTDEDKNDPDLLNNLFDITYEPCLELSTPDQMPCLNCGGTGAPDWKPGTGMVGDETCVKCNGTGYVEKTNAKGTVLGGEKFGTYKIRINSMRNNKTEAGLQGIYQAIVLIGEKYTEDTVHVISTNKSYIGIILYFDGQDATAIEAGGVTEELDGLHIGPDSAFTINLQFSLSQIHMVAGEQGATLDAEYREIMKYSSQKDQTTIQLDIPGAFLVPSGKEYSKRVDLEDGRKKEHLGIAYMDKTFNLIPDTYKNNNIFNVTPRFNIFDEHNDKFVKPQTMISYGGMASSSGNDGSLGSGVFVNQSIGIEYDKKWFSMNEKAPTGQSRFDLFGGATKRENSAYDDSHFMNTTGYLRLVSDRGFHFGGHDLVEVLSNSNSAGINDGALYVSDNNVIGKSIANTLKPKATNDFHAIDTQGITADGISGGLVIDSNESNFYNLSGLTAFGTYKASAFNHELVGSTYDKAKDDPYYCSRCEGTGELSGDPNVHIRYETAVHQYSESIHEYVEYLAEAPERIHSTDPGYEHYKNFNALLLDADWHLYVYTEETPGLENTDLIRNDLYNGIKVTENDGVVYALFGRAVKSKVRDNLYEIRLGEVPWGTVITDVHVNDASVFGRIYVNNWMAPKTEKEGEYSSMDYFAALIGQSFAPEQVELIRVKDKSDIPNFVNLHDDVYQNYYTSYGTTNYYVISLFIVNESEIYFYQCDWENDCKINEVNFATALSAVGIWMWPRVDKDGVERLYLANAQRGWHEEHPEFDEKYTEVCLAETSDYGEIKLGGHGVCPTCSGDGRVGAYTWPGRLMMYGLNTSAVDFCGFNNTFIGHKGLLSNYGHDAIIFGKHNACGNKEYDLCLACAGEGRILCKTCSGSGKVVGIPKQDCTACLAYGYVTYSGDKCTLCNGTGIINNKETCYMCGGNKYENYPGLEDYTCSAFVSGYDAIYTCPVCSGTTEIDVPDTTAYVACTNCEGIGRSKCPGCDGEGFNEGYIHPLAQSGCPTCVDKLTACQSCTGQGYYGTSATCITCDGTGSFNGSECMVCSGKGYITGKTCTFCEGDRQVCFNCSGYGDLSCDVCGGDDKIDCPECNSPSDVVCDFCDGTGWTTDSDKIKKYVGELEGQHYLEWSKEIVKNSKLTCQTCNGTGFTPYYRFVRFVPKLQFEENGVTTGSKRTVGGGITKYAIFYINAAYIQNHGFGEILSQQVLLDTMYPMNEDNDEYGYCFSDESFGEKNTELYSEGWKWKKPYGLCKTNGTFNKNINKYGASVKLFDSYAEAKEFITHAKVSMHNIKVLPETQIFDEKIWTTYNDVGDWVKAYDASKWQTKDGMGAYVIVSFDDCFKEALYLNKAAETQKYDSTTVTNTWWPTELPTDFSVNDPTKNYTAWVRFKTEHEANSFNDTLLSTYRAQHCEPGISIEKFFNSKYEKCKSCLGSGYLHSFQFKCPVCSNIEAFKTASWELETPGKKNNENTWLKVPGLVPEHLIMFKNYYTASASRGHYNPNVNLLGKHACEVCDGIGYVSRDQRVSFLGEAFETRYERLYQNVILWDTFFKSPSSVGNTTYDYLKWTMPKMLYIGTEPSSGYMNYTFEPAAYPSTGLSSLCPKCTDFFNHFMTQEMFNADVELNNGRNSIRQNNIYGYSNYKKKNVKDKIWKTNGYDNEILTVKNLGADSFCTTCNFNGEVANKPEQIACCECHGKGYSGGDGELCDYCKGSGIYGKDPNKYDLYKWDSEGVNRLYFNGSMESESWEGKNPNIYGIDSCKNTVVNTKTEMEKIQSKYGGTLEQLDAKCTYCNATGLKQRVLCETCNGTGKTTTTFTEGTIQCPSCIGGYVTCEECNGVKHWFCTTCGGDGIVEFQPTIAYEDGKVMAVGDGYFYKNLMTDEKDFDMYRDYINIKPADNCDLNVGQYIKKMNLFSVEQNGMLMVHNNNYDQIPDPHVKHNLASDFFAVRSWAKYNDLEDRFANLQNGCYAPDAIYFTKRTAHNEEWKLRIRELDYLLNDSYIKTNASMLKTAALNQAIYDFHRKNTTFLLRLGPIINYCWKGKKGYTETLRIKGTKTIKGSKGKKGSKGAKGLFAGMKGGKGWKGGSNTVTSKTVTTWTTKTVNKERVYIAYQGSTLGVKGDKGMKGLKGLKGLDEFKGLELHITGYRYKYYISDILAAIKQEFGRSISNTGNLGKNSETYTIYCMNGDPSENLYFKGVRLRKMANGNYQTLNYVKGIKPAQVQRIVYKDNGYNGEYGVMNFNYAYNNRFLA